MNATTVDPAEVERFARIAEEWWDADGKFAPLHRLNPARIGFVRDRVAAHFNRDPLKPAPLAGLRLLDIGCGGGLVCEPMRRLGADVVGIDAAEQNVAVARLHAERMGLTIDYRADAAERLSAAGDAFDVVLALEVVEHVADPDLFLRCCADLVKPGGVLVLSTLNRTAKAFALGIVGAEYVLGWLPRGTHDWRKFLKPSMLARPLRAAGLTVEALAGLAYSPVTGRWRIDPDDLDVNYLMVATKAA
ncbi:bifunctional 2-polyprenyl-6-hydroxyphenol methylase/3-demethylubiquinol 3-O-methyltransferase UbiG [Vineibacter terrae]|uniref:bifunctional 2-polyprenyl-6-hydroxyphenol methylase/3-demethylubiquinol 3-O-methyltransferase UbiG n=1 Tax=Vineibacter terrae TaxID=2586908 RepID=UPI002E36C368|nr:bifunctional 2-polyprenyl-6-hydroxyphenol methylase/3-demethylubiquinol 3-O-methyltransferase UbiG [Vineibacter terrae]HEX2890513.1 bifunctional 2-polyprenyl-6-hydroxyphenol methylase/3-demethylubiquinol 3-O-methyltransferase UbiG [Vineibacter terrae]